MRRRLFAERPARGVSTAVIGALASLAIGWSAPAGAAIDADIGPAALDLDPGVTATRVADLVFANNDELAASIIYRATLENPRLTMHAIVEALLIVGVDITMAVAASVEAQPEAAGDVVFSVASAVGMRTGGEGDSRDMSLVEQIASAAIAGIKTRERAAGDASLTSGDVRIQVASVAAELTPFIGDEQRASFLAFVIFEANIAGYTLSQLTENILTFSTGDADADDASDLLDTTTTTPTKIGSSSR